MLSDRDVRCLLQFLQDVGQLELLDTIFGVLLDDFAEDQPSLI